MPPKKPASPPKRGRGRPPEPDALSHDKPIQFRAFADQKTRWEEGAAAAEQSFSEWAREGLDAWLDVTKRAGELETSPAALLDEVFENDARVRAVLAELRGLKSLSKNEERLLRLLAPTEWARRTGS